MKIKIKLIVIVMTAVALVAEFSFAVDFKDNAEKVKWIKEFFKDKEFDQDYPENLTKNEIEFRKQLLKDFITQNGIEHIEPIAVGKSIDDPEIAKFNKACPNRKPINVYRYWDPAGSRIAYEASEEILEDPKYAGVWQFKRERA